MAYVVKNGSGWAVVINNRTAFLGKSESECFGWLKRQAK